MRITIEHCLQLPTREQAGKVGLVALQPRTRYHVGRFFPPGEGEFLAAPLCINLPSDLACFDRSALTLLFDEDKRALQVWTHASAGIRVWGRGMGARIYSSNQVVRLPLHEGHDLDFMVHGLAGQNALFRVYVGGDEKPGGKAARAGQLAEGEYWERARIFQAGLAGRERIGAAAYPSPQSSIYKRICDGDWSRITPASFGQATLCASQPNRTRYHVQLLLTYLSVVIYNTWCAQGQEFPSATQLCRLANEWVRVNNSQLDPVRPKQLTEYGRGVARLYDLNVASATVWPLVGMSLTYMEALSAVHAVEIEELLRARGICYEDFFC